MKRMGYHNNVMTTKMKEEKAVIKPHLNKTFPWGGKGDRVSGG